VRCLSAYRNTCTYRHENAHAMSDAVSQICKQGAEYEIVMAPYNLTGPFCCFLLRPFLYTAIIAFDVSSAGPVQTSLYHYPHFINGKSAAGNTKLRLPSVIPATCCPSCPRSHTGELGYRLGHHENNKTPESGKLQSRWC